MKRLLPLALFLFAWIPWAEGQTSFAEQLAQQASTLADANVVYDPGYFRMDYPNGDIPKGKGVCTDVVIRAYRKVGIDLQKEVHDDMEANFGSYPKNWGRSTTDPNIDHRRVPNLMTFFRRNGITMPVTQLASDYLPGDIVCWNLGGGVNHIGLVVTERSADGVRPLLIHNIGAGQMIEDVLFQYKEIGHFRYGH